MTIVAEIRRIAYAGHEKLRVDLFRNGVNDPPTHGDLIHTLGQVDATDTEEAQVRAALRTLGIQERPTR